ncbi:MAG: hypothetical protein ACR2MG_03405 [Pyrinomonadaceae bacterium]
MSTTQKRFLVNLVICCSVLLFVSAVSAQQIEANIKVVSISPAVLRVEGKFLQENAAQPEKNWVFLRSFAGIENLGERISELNLTNKQGHAISFKKLIEGEYLAENGAVAWSYRVNLNPTLNEKAMAHISWLKDEQGILMPGDLLPQFSAENQPVSAKIKFELPKDWKIFSNEKAIAENTFNVANIEKAVFAIGKNWRETKISTENDALNLAISGEWNFSDAEASKMANDIFSEYQKLFGEVPNIKAQILLAHFPKEIKFGRWEAETRGSTVTILSSDMPFKTLSLQRLHEQLRHEIFHLWIPNNLALTGNYDWFYEGFTVYQSLKTGLQTNQIRFEDFLDTLSQASNSDNFQSRKVSLVEASKNRWNGANSRVYSRGMIVAFLCDVALLRESKGKRSITDIFRRILNTYRLPNKPQEGSIAVLNVLGNYAELQPIIEKYIKGTEKINWREDLESVGIEAAETDFNTKLNVKAKLNKRQKDLLGKLGYNNWRKILE